MSNGGTTQDSIWLDPFQFWRRVYETNEQAWTRVIRDVVTVPEYAEAQGKMLETFLAFQKMMRDGMTAQLSILNVPTGDDVARLGELIVGLEEKGDQVGEQLAAIQPRLVDLDEGMEKSADRLDQRLAGLEQLITDLDKKNGHRIDKLEERLSDLEKKIGHRIDRLEDRLPDIEKKIGGRVDKLGERLPGLESRLDDHGKRLEKIFEELVQRLESLDKRLAQQPAGGSESAPARGARASAASARPAPQAGQPESTEKPK